MKKSIIVLSSFFVLTISNLVIAQNNQIVTRAVLENGDTLPVFNLPTFEIIAFKKEKDARKFQKLQRDIVKAYPYAKLASKTLYEINNAVSTIESESERKDFIKLKEKEMKSKFEKDLKSLSFNQGKILIKLIDRETGKTGYELVKELRGSFQAFFWQNVARIFGSSLKSEYDADGEDSNIESIIKSIEQGYIQVIVIG